MKTKRILSVVLSLVMILTALPLTAVSSFAETSGDFEYKILDDGTVEITKYKGSATELEIPSTLDGYTVTSLGEYSFGGNTSLTSIIMPNSITVIGRMAFCNCKLLVSITIPDSVTTIENDAFWKCASLTSITIPNSVTEIGESAFNDCSSLTNIEIPDSVESIGNIAFTGTAYYNNEANWESGVLYISHHLVATDKENVPSNYKIKAGTISIAEDAFREMESLESIEIPDSVIGIGSSAFDGCTSLKNVIIPKSVKSIGNSAFSYCFGLEKLVISDGVVSIERYAFMNCFSLESVIIPSSVTNIGYRAFGYLEGYFDDIVEGEYAWDCRKWDDFKIYGDLGTAAERYAKENGITFMEIGTFPDVPKDQWFYDAVKFNVEKGYFKGYENGNFGPANNIQRQDFVVVLSRIAGVDLSAYEGQNGGMSDVPKNDYYSAAVAWAVDNNIITGYKNGKFGVGDSITREQVCAIFYRYMQNYCSKDMTLSKSESAILARFGDRNKISDWAVTNVAWAVDKGVISGTQSGNVNPAGNANRAEISKILMNMSNNGLI